MISLYDQFLEMLTKLLKFFLASFFMFALILGILQVLARYILPINLSWSFELTRFIFVWMVMIGAALGGKEKGHIAMEFVISRFGINLRRKIEFILTLVCLLVFIILFIFGFQITLRNIAQLSATMQISMAIPYSAIPIGFLLLILYYIRHIIELLQWKDTKTELSDNDSKGEVAVNG